MLGAIIGDIIGSPYEFDRNNIKTTDFPLFGERSRFTDDTVMTLAVAEALMEGGNSEDYVKAMRKYGKLYPYAGYGQRFAIWLCSSKPEPYNSYGNGSAMRVSSVGWWYQTLEAVEEGAECSAIVTHNHPEGIKGAQATAAAIFLARTGKSKAEIKAYIETRYGYDLSRTLDEIRPNYRHVESCQETVPEAITAFLESDGFEDAIRKAVSLGGDSDTLAAITGSIAEAAYGVPEPIKDQALSRLDETLLSTLKRWESISRGVNEKVAAVCEYLFPYIDYFNGRPQLDKTETFDGAIIHNIEVKNFLKVFYEKCRLFVDYFGILERYGMMRFDESRIASANMELLWAILTRFIRSGRVNPDEFPYAIEEGHIGSILKRLRELHDRGER
jgi:ADP-ribosylglycohydrolase